MEAIRWNGLDANIEARILAETQVSFMHFCKLLSDTTHSIWMAKIQIARTERTARTRIHFLHER